MKEALYFLVWFMGVVAIVYACNAFFPEILEVFATFAIGVVWAAVALHIYLADKNHEA